MGQPGWKFALSDSARLRVWSFSLVVLLIMLFCVTIELVGDSRMIAPRHQALFDVGLRGVILVIGLAVVIKHLCLVARVAECCRAFTRRGRQPTPQSDPHRQSVRTDRTPEQEDTAV